jgi:hypothetical protein
MNPRRRLTTRRLRKASGLAPAAEPACEAAPALSAEEMLESLLAQIAKGGKLCQEIERQFKQHLCPELETIIKLHRTLVLTLCGQAQDMPDRAALVSALMKPVMEWARLEENRKRREWAEQKHRAEVAARQAATTERAAPKVLTPETLERIERELNLF